MRTLNRKRGEDMKTGSHTSNIIRIIGDVLLVLVILLTVDFEPTTFRLGVHQKATHLYVYNISLRLYFPRKSTLCASHENRFELTEFISV